MLCLLILYVIPACKKSVGMNDVNYEVDRSTDIYSCVQADKFMFKHAIFF